MADMLAQLMDMMQGMGGSMGQNNDNGNEELDDGHGTEEANMLPFPYPQSDSPEPADD